MVKKYPPGIMINKATMDRLKGEDRPGDLLALYAWYCYTASWQDTNVVWANVTYMAELTKWSVEKVRRIRKKLKGLGLIEDVQERGDDSKFGKRYVIVNYMSVPPKTRSTVNQSDMCLYINTKYEAVKKRPHATLLGNYKDFATRYGAKIQTKLNIQATVRNKGKVKHVPVKATTWAKEIVYILHNMRVHKEVFKAVMKWYLNEGMKEKYTPRIFKVKDLVEKWPKIVDAMSRCQEEACSLPKRKRGANGEYGWYE